MAAIWFLLGVVSITMLTLATWLALREAEIPRLVKWSMVAGALALSGIFVESVAWFLLVSTMLVTLSLPIRNVLRDWPRRAKVALALGTGSLCVAVLASTPLDLAAAVNWALPQESGNGPPLALASLLLLVSIAGTAWILRSVNDPYIRRAYLRTALIWFAVSFFPFWYFFGMTTFERTIVHAVNGEIRPDTVGAVQWRLEQDTEEGAWLRELPAASDARCPVSLLLNGACCLVEYPDGRNSEIHIFRTGFGRYTVNKFTRPARSGLCRNPLFDPRADPESPAGREFVRCEPSQRS